MAKVSQVRSKARNVINGVMFSSKTFWGLLILVLLYRFYSYEFFSGDKTFIGTVVFEDMWGHTDQIRTFDVFAWLKSASVSMDGLRGAYNSFIENISNLGTGDPLSSILNIFIVPTNILLAIVKILLFIPLAFLGILFGGFFAQWTSPGGWCYGFLQFWIPYNNEWWASALTIFFPFATGLYTFLTGKKLGA